MAFPQDYNSDHRARSWPLRTTVACLLLVVGSMGIFASVRLSCCPVSVVLKDVSPAEIMDGAGKGMWQVTLALTNSEPLQFEPNCITIEAKTRSSWISPDGHLAGFWSGRTSGMIFVVPSGTTHYRLRFRYQRETLKWRLWEKLGQRGRTLVTKYAPAISARVWPRAMATTFHNPPVWTHAMLMAPLPPKVNSEPL